MSRCLWDGSRALLASVSEWRASHIHLLVGSCFAVLSADAGHSCASMNQSPQRHSQSMGIIKKVRLFGTLTKTAHDALSVRGTGASLVQLPSLQRAPHEYRGHACALTI